MIRVSLILALLGGVLLWSAVPVLCFVYGLWSLQVGLMYTAGATAVMLVLKAWRGVGLFMAGGFAAGCCAGAWISLIQYRQYGLDEFVSVAIGLVVGAVAVGLACLPRAAQLGPAAGTGTRCS